MFARIGYPNVLSRCLLNVYLTFIPMFSLTLWSALCQFASAYSLIISVHIVTQLTWLYLIDEYISVMRTWFSIRFVYTSSWLFILQIWGDILPQMVWCHYHVVYDSIIAMWPPLKLLHDVWYQDGHLRLISGHELPHLYRYSCHLTAKYALWILMQSNYLRCMCIVQYIYGCYPLPMHSFNQLVVPSFWNVFKLP